MPPKDTTKSRPAPLACLECRQAHLKCDGVTPACARCAARGCPCNYTISRRGRRPAKRRHSHGSQRGQHSPFNATLSSPWNSSRMPEAAGLDVMEPIVDGQEPIAGSELPLIPTLQYVSPHHSVEQEPEWVDDEQLVNLFYLNFHPNHPILLPRSMYRERGYPRFLRIVVEFIGSHFFTIPPDSMAQDNVAREMDLGQQDTPEMVQARTLFAIILLARNQSRLCAEVLDSAIDSALKLGMHRREFTMTYANLSSLREESMRRTWYELYVVDGCIAASQRKSSFKTATVHSNVLLPCEDSLYESGLLISGSNSREDYEMSSFSDTETVFSSFCYRIEAVSLLSRVLAIAREHGVQREQVQAVDNALAAFVHHLPSSKSEPQIVSFSGEVDRLMFQAHMIIQHATLLLHFPRGDLIFPGPFSSDLPRDSTSKFACPCTRQQVHSVKAIDASKSVSMLAAFRIPIQRQTPLLIYPLAISVVVQLSAYLAYTDRSNICLEQHQDRTKLLLGVLKSFRQHWSIAGVLLSILNKVAQTVFSPLNSGALDTLQQEVRGDSHMFSLTQVVGGESVLDNLDVQNLNELLGLDTATFCS